jgi:hypothetical protein
MNLAGRTTLGMLGLWHGLAATQNAFDILADTEVIPELRPLASKNLSLMAKLTAPLEPSKSALVALLSAAAAIEAAACLAFFRGALAGTRSDAGFALSLLLFGAFFTIDDAFDDYDLGAKHRAIFTMLAAAYAATRAAEGP